MNMGHPAENSEIFELELNLPRLLPKLGIVFAPDRRLALGKQREIRGVIIRKCVVDIGERRSRGNLLFLTLCLLRLLLAPGSGDSGIGRLALLSLFLVRVFLSNLLANLSFVIRTVIYRTKYGLVVPAVYREIMVTP